jgi:hypothetical protein
MMAVVSQGRKLFTAIRLAHLARVARGIHEAEIYQPQAFTF